MHHDKLRVPLAFAVKPRLLGSAIPQHCLPLFKRYFQRTRGHSQARSCQKPKVANERPQDGTKDRT